MTFATLNTARPLTMTSDIPAGVIGQSRYVETEEDFFSSSQSAEAFTYRTSVLTLSDNRHLRMPIGVEVRRTRTYVSVEEPRTGIFGVGGTTAEAMADFREAVQDFKEVLDQETELGAPMKELQALLLLMSRD